MAEHPPEEPRFHELRRPADALQSGREDYTYRGYRILQIAVTQTALYAELADRPAHTHWLCWPLDAALTSGNYIAVRTLDQAMAEIDRWRDAASA